MNLSPCDNTKQEESLLNPILLALKSNVHVALKADNYLLHLQAMYMYFAILTKNVTDFFR